MTHRPRPGIHPKFPPRTWEYDEEEMNSRANMYAKYCEPDTPLRRAFEIGWFEARHAHGVFLPNEHDLAEPHPLDKRTPEQDLDVQATFETKLSGYTVYWSTHWKFEWAQLLTRTTSQEDINVLLDHQPSKDGCCTTCAPPLQRRDSPFATAAFYRSYNNSFPCETFTNHFEGQTEQPVCQLCFQLEDTNVATACTHEATPWPAITEQRSA